MLHDLIIRPFESGYMQRALIEVVLLGVLGGIVGVHVMMRKMAFVTEVVQHTVFPGIAIAFAFGHSLLLGALCAGALSMVLLTVGTRRSAIDSDSFMALLIATFFAFGVIVVSRQRSFQSDLTALLFGRILTVDRQEIVDTIIVGAISVIVLWALHKELVMRAFDPAYTGALGYRIDVIDLVLNLVVMLIVVAAVRAVGTVLVVAFIVTPAAAARLVFRRVRTMMVASALGAAVCGWIGLIVIFHGSIDHGWRVAAGSTIVLVFTLAFVIVWAASAVFARRGRGSGSAASVEAAS